MNYINLKNCIQCLVHTPYTIYTLDKPRHCTLCRNKMVPPVHPSKAQYTIYNYWIKTSSYVCIYPLHGAFELASLLLHASRYFSHFAVSLSLDHLNSILFFVSWWIYIQHIHPVRMYAHTHSTTVMPYKRQLQVLCLIICAYMRTYI